MRRFECFIPVRRHRVDSLLDVRSNGCRDIPLHQRSELNDAYQNAGIGKATCASHNPAYASPSLGVQVKTHQPDAAGQPGAPGGRAGDVWKFGREGAGAVPWEWMSALCHAGRLAGGVAGARNDESPAFSSAERRHLKKEHTKAHRTGAPL